MKYNIIKEEELKIKVSQDYFWLFDCSKIIGNVDFCVVLPHHNNKEMKPLVSTPARPLVETQSLLWAEAKKGTPDIYKSFVQLILTIGKERTFDKFLPPAFLGAFDYEKIAFIPYNEIHDIFYLNDFNWNVAPSNHETKEFKMLYELAETRLTASLQFNFINDDTELKRFIKLNFADNQFGLTKIKIDKNNFISIYNKWLETVKPTIQVKDWELLKKDGIIDGDFYLADLLSIENETLKEKLNILLRSNYYESEKHENKYGFFTSSKIEFADNQKAHKQFWTKYERPPLEEYWKYITERRDLLVPQDIRERKGSFFTPRIWVELSQKYLADVLGEDWQDEYYVWDCCAGTGNLLVGLTNKYNIWASTLDQADVDVMKDRIENGANLLEDHVFQFDFLNDDFTKLPKRLQDIINDEKKRKKLVIYINPPYAEATSTATRVGTRENKTGVATGNKTHLKYFKKMGKARNELFAQFLTRIYFEIPGCKIGEFSKQKVLVAPNFKEFRIFFDARLEKGFIVPADSFDNVKGKFPIGFKIWDTAKGRLFENSTFDAYCTKGKFLQKKIFEEVQDSKYINDWIKNYRDKDNNITAKLCYVGNDFQNNIKVHICSLEKKIIAHDVVFNITQSNLIVASIYFAVRKVIPATWLNDRDQFLYPNDAWKTDLEFQNDCLAYTLFHNSNNISSKYGKNYWIPFTEYGVSAREKFDSKFMTEFINGKIVEPEASEPLLFYADTEFGGGGGAGLAPAQKREFSETAQKVFKAGGDLWRHYHNKKFAESGQGGYNVNASLYDIREHFQKRNDKGIMNAKSKDDEKYNELNETIRLALKHLAEKIEPKIYEYRFLIN